MALLAKITIPKNLDSISQYDVGFAPCVHKEFKEKVLPYIFLHVSVYPAGYILNVQDCLGLIVILETDYGKVVDQMDRQRRFTHFMNLCGERGTEIFQCGKDNYEQVVHSQ